MQAFIFVSRAVRALGWMVTIPMLIGIGRGVSDSTRALTIEQAGVEYQRGTFGVVLIFLLMFAIDRAWSVLAEDARDRLKR